MSIQGLRGRYTVEGLIASGGLGRVWRARSDKGNTVAIKEPLTDGAPDRIRINFEKLRVEALVLERLTGTRPLLLSQRDQVYFLDPRVRIHVVQFVDVDNGARRPNGQVFPNALVMEYVSGESLDEVFRKSQDSAKVEYNCEKTLEIVNKLHENNILHRDISPHNLMLTGSQRDPILIDFGTAKEGYNQLSQTDMSIIMHPGYSAPELATGQAFPSSDLYSVAATCLFMYTGTNPAYLMNKDGKLDTVRRSQLQRIEKDRLQIIEKAMSFNPHDRYQTAQDMLDALESKAPAALPPHLIASGRKFVIEDEVIVGRLHSACGDDCQRKGFSVLPDISLNDPERYISKHHARIGIGPRNECFIEEIGPPYPPSGTAVKHTASPVFEKLQPGREYRLIDGDVIALAYSPLKGAYMTISYRES